MASSITDPEALESEFGVRFIHRFDNKAQIFSPGDS